MRKITLIIALVLTTTSATWAQSQRRVFIEEINNVSAPVSASENSSVDLWLENNNDKHISIQYQANTPAPNPMYVDEVQERINQYNITNIPTGLIDGTIPTAVYTGFDSAWYAGAPAGFSAEMLENRYLVPSPFQLAVNFTLNPNAIDITANVLCTQSISGNLKLRLIIIEKQIDFDSAPGNNGELLFKNIFRAFAGGSSGIALMENWETGQSQEITQSWNHQNIFSYSQIAVVAIIQDDNSLEIHQSEINYSANYHSELTNAARLLNIELPAETCSGNSEVSPVVSIRNTGLSDITSCQFSVNVNGDEFVQNVVLNLPFMADTAITLDAINYSAEQSNDVAISCLLVNNTANEDFNNTLNWEIESTNNLISTFLTVSVQTDCFPEETTWKITSSDGNVVAQGGPYTGQINSQIIVPVILDGGCYRFEYFDSYGDGLFGSQWNGCSINGSFSVIDTAGHLLFGYDGSYNLPYFEAIFEADIVNATIDSEQALTFGIYPNPASDYLTIETGATTNDASITIVNSIGQIVKQVNGLGNEYGNRYIDLSRLVPGIYFIQLSVNEKSLTKKLIIKH